jgi:hypothetical protein
MTERLQQSWHSFLSLPAWVQVWVGLVLIPANAASFFLLDYRSGQMAALAAAFVVVTNVPIMLCERGMSKLMAIPHLFAWGPLVVILVLRLAEHSNASEFSLVEQVFAIVIVTVNGISLAFDVVDSWRWLRGDRSVPHPL